MWLTQDFEILYIKLQCQSFEKKSNLDLKSLEIK